MKMWSKRGTARCWRSRWCLPLRAGKFNGHPLPQGKLAVLYDKNKLEVLGYAATLADLSGESVYLVPCYADDLDPKVSELVFFWV
jgi:hypothetical protein